MSFASLTLVVLAAFIHATWNLLSKRAAAAGPAFVLAYNVVAIVAYLPWVTWLLTHGAMTWNFPVACCLLLSGLLHLAYSLCLQRGYQVADLSVVYPVARGSGPMLSSVGAFLLLGEIPSQQGLPGLLAVVVGIGLISRRKAISPGSVAPRAMPGCAGARLPACSLRPTRSLTRTESRPSGSSLSFSTGSRIWFASSCSRRSCCGILVVRVSG